jgi:CheY-like chemotaxis protein
MSKNMKMIFAEDLMPVGYLCIISIDAASGYGTCLLPMINSPSQWDPSHFPYDEAMTYLIERNIAEDDINRTIQNMSLSTVIRELSGKNSYQVYYSCAGDNHTVIYRKASFMKRKEGDILLFLQDITDDALTLRKANVRLQEEYKEAVSQSNIASRMLHLLDREFRTHLFSLGGLTDMMMEENSENEYGSSHYNRADKLIEQTYVTQNHMMESLNDVRELQNVIRWDQNLQSDLISIEEMLQFFDGPLSEHCEFMNTLFSWDASGVKHQNIISDETILTSLLSRLVRHIISNSSPSGYLQLMVSEKEEEGDTSIYTFSILSDRCNLSVDQLAAGTMDYQGLFKEMQKDLNAIDFNLILLKKYTELLDGSFSVKDLEEGKQINLAFRFRRGPAVISSDADICSADGSSGLTGDDTSGSESIREIVQDPFHVRNLDEYTILSHSDNSDEVFSTPDFTGKTALVIDDNLINLEVTSRLLRNAGFLVVDMDDGQKGYDAYLRDQGRFDIIILDIRMPGITGIEVARRIRAAGVAGAEIPIIALTANDRPEERQQSIEAGMNDHLSKPVSPYVLYKVIEKYL